MPPESTRVGRNWVLIAFEPESEVMELVVAGLLNKEIADMLHISIKTVENHRAHVMQKMQARNLAAQPVVGAAFQPRILVQAC